MKILVVQLVCALLLLCTIGCSKKDIDVGPAVEAALIVGTWQVTTITADPAVVSPTYGTTTDILQLYRQNIGRDCISPTRYVFRADGTLQLTTSSECQHRLTSLFGFTNAEWRISGRTLRIEGLYDVLSYMVIEQTSQRMICQRTEYNSPFDGQSHQYTITFSKT